MKNFSLSIVLIVLFFCIQSNAAEKILFPLERPSLDTETTIIYPSEADWRYAHHPAIGQYLGKFFVMWSSGKKDEDSPGQVVRISQSSDFKTWERPKFLNNEPEQYPGSVETAVGFISCNKGLVAFYGKYNYSVNNLKSGERPEGDFGHANTKMFAKISVNGIAWNKQQELELNMIANSAPVKIKDNYLIMPGNFTIAKTEDPCGLQNYYVSSYIKDIPIGKFADDSEGFHQAELAVGIENGLCEAGVYALKDGSLKMFLRSSEAKLWSSESKDNAKSWSAPIPTQIPNDTSKFAQGKTPDGRYYLIGNLVTPSGRSVLILALSNDGIKFDKQYTIIERVVLPKFSGKAKGGTFAYPSVTFKEDKAYVVVSVGKEQIWGLKFTTPK